MNKTTFLLLLSFLLPFNFYGQGVVINEVLASNTSVNADEDGHNNDWIELHNTGSTSVNLTGYGLTDDAEVPYKWVFPNVTLAAGAYRLVWCSDKNRINPSSPLHTNFKISASGEQITLTNPGGSIVDFAPATATLPDVSLARIPNGTGPFTLLQNATPGAANSGTGVSGQLAPPTFSHAGGFYPASFSLSIDTSEPGATILYTLDGSEPDESKIGGFTYEYKQSHAELAGQPNGAMLTNSYETLTYSEPLTIVDRTPMPNKISAMSSTQHFAPSYIPNFPVFKATIVRAKVIKDGWLPSATVTRTFFVTPLGANEFTFPVVASLSIDEDLMYNFHDGIFIAGADFEEWRADNPNVNTTPYNFEANFYRKGDWSERPAHIDFFVNGTEVVNQDIGLRLAGDSSRAWPSKSFNLLARSEYGNSSFQYQFFDDVPVTTFNRLLLRNSGNDFRRTMYRDALAQSLVKDVVEIQAYRPTVTFVNGEYWGILNLRERYDRFYFKNVYNINEGELDMLENDTTAEEGDNTHYLAMINYLQNNSLAIGANYDYIKTQLDPEDYRDYYITNIYLSNTDWPGWNTTFWRKRTTFTTNVPKGHDGRWRTAMKDTDSAFGLSTNSTNHNTLAHATEPNGPSYPNPPISTLILRSLLDNPQFQEDFISRFADMLNTYFLPSRVLEMSNAMKNTITPEMPDHIARWKAFTLNNWNSYINLMHTFINERPAHQRDHIRGKFNISNNINATVDVSSSEQGYIKVNTINILPTTPGISTAPYPWSGVYFSGIPVMLKAVARPGYMFSHWSGDSESTNTEISIISADDFSVTAHFVPDDAPQTVQPIYFWMIDNNVANDVPLESLSSTYQSHGLPGTLNYQSSLAGYPFTPASPFWRTASMERRNNPTEINYIPEANSGLSFEASNMRGLQIKQPFQTGNMENTLIFDMQTNGYQDARFSFAALDEGAASGLMIDYSTSEGEPQWTNSNLPQSTMSLTGEYQLYEVDFSDVPQSDNNDNFKVRIRFTGSDMTANDGNRVTFNNFALHGTVISLDLPSVQSSSFIVYPNPFSNVINVSGVSADATYKLFNLQGQLIGKGAVSGTINGTGLPAGIYVLQITSDGLTEIKKVLKR